MYTHIEAVDHKNIAGIAYLQTRLQEIYPDLKIDGMLGNETLLAFRTVLKDAFHLHTHGFNIEGNGIGTIQKLIMQAVQATGPAKFATAGLHDAQWGKDTKAAIDYILDPFVRAARFKAIAEELGGKPRPASKLSKRVLNGLRHRVERHSSSCTPLVYDAPNKVKDGVHWCTGEEFEVTEQTVLLLCKAMKHENAVVTIHQMLAAGWEIALYYHKGRAVGIVILRPFFSIPMTKNDPHIKHASIEGIYVNSPVRGCGFGTQLLIAVRYRAKELEIKRVIFIQGPACCSLEDTVFGNVRTVKERIFNQLINGHGYRSIMSVHDLSRAERCVLDIN